MGLCRSEIFSAFSEFSRLAQRKISLVHRRRIRRSSTKLVPAAFVAQRPAVGRDLRERSTMAVSWSDERHSSNIPRFCFSERKSSKISKTAITAKTYSYQRRGRNVHPRADIVFAYIYDNNRYHIRGKSGDLGLRYVEFVELNFGEYPKITIGILFQISTQR